MHHLDSLGSIAAHVAMSAAAVYLAQHKIRIPQALETDAAEIMRKHAKSKLREALDDAAAALAANMGHVAEATFKASMVVAGIDAGKEIEALIGRWVPEAV